jgi:hypothetical protein
MTLNIKQKKGFKEMFLILSQCWKFKIQAVKTN